MTRISFVVCTRNRAAGLEACLNAIRAAAQLEDGPTELILVDNGSTDATYAVAQRWRAEMATAESGLAVTLLREWRPGLAVARNRGIAAARGEILVFTDDDCLVGPTYLRALRHLSAGDTGPVIRGGRVELGDPTDLALTIKTATTAAQYDGTTHPGGFIHGCNMVINAAALAKLGGFDPLLGAGTPCVAGEDTDYIFRAYLAGVAVRYEPSLMVRHFHGRKTRGAALALGDGYARGNGALLAKHARHWNLLRHFYWDLKGAAREWRGGTHFDPAHGMSFRRLVWMTLRGAGRYARLRATQPRPLASNKNLKAAEEQADDFVGQVK